MRGYLALTDWGWFTYLRRSGPLEEVNFWQPRGGSLLDPPMGTPFFFKLHARQGGKIGGFGFFNWRSRLPAWMAWDTFREANGATDRESFLRLLAERRGEDVDATGTFTIGCLLIGQLAFFDDDAFVAAPSDWPPTGVQQGKGYNLDAGEGMRVYRECLDRAAHYPFATAPGHGADLHASPDARFGDPYSIRPRLGQNGFRVAVTDAYGRACAISREHSLPVLEAAHIKPYSEGGTHEIRNGLLLRADIHRLFDKGLVTIAEDHRFIVSSRLRSDYRNGRVYYELQERIEQSGGIHLPRDPAMHPDPELLRWHSRERFIA